MRAQVRARVVEAVDLGLEVAGRAVEDGARSRTSAAPAIARRAPARRRRRSSAVSLDGSWMVVTPKARLGVVHPVLLAARSRSRPCAPCQCTSMRPGEHGRARRRRRRARRPGRRPAPRGPTASMRLPSTSTTPSSMTSSPFMVTTRPPTRATVPVGHVRSARRSRCRGPSLGGSGSFSGAPVEEREASRQLAREQLRAERPVQRCAAVARPVQVLAGVLRDVRDRDAFALGSDVLALARARRTARRRR